MRGAASVALLCALIATRTLASELVPSVSSGRLGVSIRALKFPENLGRDLQSGLTNRIVVRLALLLDSRPVAQETVEVAVKYDLWDERFRATVAVDRAARRVDTLASLADMTAWLANLRFDALFPLHDLRPGRYQLQANILLNPVEKERLDRLRRWIAENSTPAGRLHPGSRDPSPPLSESRSSEMFNSIFELYIKGEDVVAPWHAELLSEQFTPDELDHAGH